VVFRKAHDSQLIGIRAALRGGASWEQIAEAPARSRAAAAASASSRSAMASLRNFLAKSGARRGPRPIR
jgi:hypothetical protein